MGETSVLYAAADETLGETSGNFVRPFSYILWLISPIIVRLGSREHNNIMFSTLCIDVRDRGMGGSDGKWLKRDKVSCCYSLYQ